ncbi:hypothetical protein KC906_03630 [Candidatus Kaiserbacteria bacterium]|nr:hypothetical protein [Candidatus Kaiserbacteria bacterium]MCB9812450.1 hypothetical protein [Candidatus Nomurabacteria bacterium]
MNQPDIKLNSLFKALTERVALLGLVPYGTAILIITIGMTSIPLFEEVAQSWAFMIGALLIAAALHARDQDLTAIILMRAKIFWRGRSPNYFRVWRCQHYSP